MAHFTQHWMAPYGLNFSGWCTAHALSFHEPSQSEAMTYSRARTLCRGKFIYVRRSLSCPLALLGIIEGHRLCDYFHSIVNLIIRATALVASLTGLRRHQRAPVGAVCTLTNGWYRPLVQHCDRRGWVWVARVSTVQAKPAPPFNMPHSLSHPYTLGLEQFLFHPFRGYSFRTRSAAP
jgi:hypothetical protein